MRTDQYDHLAMSIIAQTPPQLVVITLDPDPHVPLKQSPTVYAEAVTAVLDMLLHNETMAPFSVCNTTTAIVGGHSASGAAAWQAVQQGYLQRSQHHIAGYLGLDPFSIPTTELQMSLPAVYWGFRNTTCSVHVEHAARAAYHQTIAHQRVLYQLDSDSFSHCCFADDGCMGPICPCKSHDTDLLHQSIGKSVRHLLDHIAGTKRQENRLSPRDFDGTDFHLDSSLYSVSMDKDDGSLDATSMAIVD